MSSNIFPMAIDAADGNCDSNKKQDDADYNRNDHTQGQACVNLDFLFYWVGFVILLSISGVVLDTVDF